MGGIIAGIIRLFVRNPIIFFGMGMAIYYMTQYKIQVVELIFKTPMPYAIMFAVAFFYAILFKHVRKPNSSKVNWGATLLSSFTHFFTILLATAFTIAIIIAWNYAFTDSLDSYLRYKK